MTDPVIVPLWLLVLLILIALPTLFTPGFYPAVAQSLEPLVTTGFQ